jgi:hypothetical protein
VSRADLRRWRNRRDWRPAGPFAGARWGYGQLYGPGTFYQTAPPWPPRIHVDDAARLTLPALVVPPGVTIVADDRAT